MVCKVIKYKNDAQKVKYVGKDEYIKELSIHLKTLSEFFHAQDVAGDWNSGSWAMDRNSFLQALHPWNSFLEVKVLA